MEFLDWNEGNFINLAPEGVATVGLTEGLLTSGPQNGSNFFIKKEKIFSQFVRNGRTGG